MKDDGALASWASELVMVVVPYGVIVCASPTVVRVVTAGDDEDQIGPGLEAPLPSQSQRRALPVVDSVRRSSATNPGRYGYR